MIEVLKRRFFIELYAFYLIYMTFCIPYDACIVLVVVDLLAQLIRILNLFVRNSRKRKDLNA